LAVLPDHAQACSPPEAFVSRVGGAVFPSLELVEFTLGGGFWFSRRFEKTFGGLEYAQPLAFVDSFRQLVGLSDVFQEVMKILVGDALDFHPTQGYLELTAA
jgi:hypothetical protein